jgi:hypothetical protein
MKRAVSADAPCAKLSPTCFHVYFFRIVIRNADGKTVYSNVFTVSFMCTDKQDLVSVKFCLNGYEF